jgi:hypothetical protein
MTSAPRSLTPSPPGGARMARRRARGAPFRRTGRMDGLWRENGTWTGFRARLSHDFRRLRSAAYPALFENRPRLASAARATARSSTTSPSPTVSSGSERSGRLSNVALPAGDTHFSREIRPGPPPSPKCLQKYRRAHERPGARQTPRTSRRDAQCLLPTCRVMPTSCRPILAPYEVYCRRQGGEQLSRWARRGLRCIGAASGGASEEATSGDPWHVPRRECQSPVKGS